MSAQASRESAALCWSREDLMLQVMKSPLMAMNAMRIMAEQLQEVQERFRRATSDRVEQRLAAESGKKVEEGVLIDLALTRQDLAKMSGTTLYTASRMLK